jgi:hypothetical protein
MENQSGERRVYKSDLNGKPNPDFEELFRLANELAIAKNPQRWFNLSAVREDESGEEQPIMDASEVERLEVIEEIERQLGEAMVEKGESFAAFVEFIEGLDFKELEAWLEFVESLDLEYFSAEEAIKHD